MEKWRPIDVGDDVRDERRQQSRAGKFWMRDFLRFPFDFHPAGTRIWQRDELLLRAGMLLADLVLFLANLVNVAGLNRGIDKLADDADCAGGVEDVDDGVVVVRRDLHGRMRFASR